MKLYENNRKILGELIILKNYNNENRKEMVL